MARREDLSFNVTFPGLGGAPAAEVVGFHQREALNAPFRLELVLRFPGYVGDLVEDLLGADCALSIERGGGASRRISGLIRTVHLREADDAPAPTASQAYPTADRTPPADTTPTGPWASARRPAGMPTTAAATWLSATASPASQVVQPHTSTRNSGIEKKNEKNPA